MGDWRTFFQLFWSFFKIGPVTFGGGYAMIPLIEREVVKKRKWIKREDIIDVFAVVESIPGAIAINTAIFIGYRVAGVRGAIAAMMGMLFPTFTIVVILSLSYQLFKDNSYVEAAFKGIRASIVALIMYAGIKIGSTALIDKTTGIITLVTVFILLFVSVHPVIIILMGIIIGVLLGEMRRKKEISK